MTRLFLAMTIAVSTLAMFPYAGEAQKPPPKKDALPKANQVYVKIIWPGDPAKRDKNQPVVESWIAEELKKCGQTKFTAATGWVRITFDKFESTKAWDGRLNGETLACHVNGEIVERADGRVKVRLSGWGPGGDEVTVSLADEPGSRAIVAVKDLKDDTGMPYVAVLIGPPPEKLATRTDQPNAGKPDVTEESLKKCLGKTAKEIIKQFEVKDAKWGWVDEPPAILRGVRYSRDKAWLVLYIAEGEKLFRRFDENRKWNYEEFLDCKIGGIQFQSTETYLAVGGAVPFQFNRPPKAGKK